MRSYFEAEMGLTYGKMQVPPKELCVSAGGWGKGWGVAAKRKVIISVEFWVW